MNKLRNSFFIVIISLFSNLVAQDITAKSLAIPPFTNRTGDNKYDWLSEALADMLTTDIASTKKIWIVNRLELKKIISEQQLTVSGLINDQNAVTLGNMVGAGLIMTGSYTIIGNQLRVDAQIFDVEKGVAQGAASIFGNIDEFFILEKKLAVKILRELSIELPEDDKIRLFQIDSENINAIEKNYKGILALETNDVETAKKYFNAATKADPYYKKAKINLESVSIDVEGVNLLGKALSEIDRKNEQLKVLKAITEEFIDTYYSITIDGQPEITTNSKNPDFVDFKVSFTVDANLDAVKKFTDKLKDISNGDEKITFNLSRLYKYDEEKREFTFSLYKENWSWFKNKYIKLSLGFTKLKLLQIKIGENVLDETEVWFRIGNIRNISNPVIYCTQGKSGEGMFGRGRSPAKISITFTNISIDKLKQIDKIEFVDPPLTTY